MGEESGQGDLGVRGWGVCSTGWRTRARARGLKRGRPKIPVFWAALREEKSGIIGSIARGEVRMNRESKILEGRWEMGVSGVAKRDKWDVLVRICASLVKKRVILRLLMLPRNGVRDVRQFVGL